MKNSMVAAQIRAKARKQSAEVFCFQVYQTHGGRVSCRVFPIQQRHRTRPRNVAVRTLRRFDMGKTIVPEPLIWGGTEQVLMSPFWEKAVERLFPKIGSSQQKRLAHRLLKEIEAVEKRGVERYLWLWSGYFTPQGDVVKFSLDSLMPTAIRMPSDPYGLGSIFGPRPCSPESAITIVIARLRLLYGG